MKKLLAVLLSAALCMGALSGCRRSDKNDTMTPDPTPNNPSTEAPVTDGNSSGSGSTGSGTPDAPDKTNPDSVPHENTTNSLGEAVLREGVMLEDVIMQLGTDLGITMPTKLDDAALKDQLGIEPEWVEEYYGEYSAADTSADHLLAFKVKEGHLEDVKNALEKRRNTLLEGYGDDMKEQRDKVQNATVVEKAPYVFFIIAGDYGSANDKEVNKASDIINSYFD